ncbi:MAG: TonB-dependent receptor [Bacteroidales bacterium]|nr:TonB-dependent receptor [Bacteroidales bacterium]MCF8390184.1 TonB-dependent receptor [Bacteroidales bacterium]
MSVLLISASQSYAQFSLSGIVLDEKSNPLVGASVYFSDSNMGKITGKSGKFEFRNLKAGNVQLNVSFVGYETFRKEITIEGNMDIQIQIHKSNFLMDEVVVKSIRAGENDPVAMSIMKKEDIEVKNLGHDIPTLLSLSPSIVSTSDAGHGIGYSGFRIRGTDANRINITVDGIPLNDSESHGVWWVNMPDLATSIEDIQIQRGVGTSTNGAAAFGASVNFQTMGLEKEAYTRVDAGYGSFNTYKTAVSIGTGLIDEHFSFNLRLSDIHSDGFIDRARSDLNSYYFSATYHDEKTLIKFKNFSGTEEVYQAWGGVPSELLETNPTYNPMGEYTDSAGQKKYYVNQIDHYKQQHYHLSASRTLSSTLSFNTALHYTKGAGYYEEYKEDAALLNYNIDNFLMGGELIENTDLIRQKWLDNDFYGMIFSFNYLQENYNASVGGSVNNYSGVHFGEVIWASAAGYSEKGHRWYNNTGSKPEFNLYAKLNYNLNPSVNLYGDMQMRKIDYEINGIDDDLRDISQTHHFLFLNPKMGVNYRPNAENRIFASFSIANREPNRSNFVDADPAQTMPQFETLYDYEVGHQWMGDYFRTEINLFYMDYTNQLVLTGEINDVGAAIMTNVKDSYRAGIELSAALNFSKYYRWQGNFTLSRNKIINMTSFVDNWDYWNDPVNEVYQYESELENTDIAFSPFLTAGSFFSLNATDNLQFNLQSKFVSKQFTDNSSSNQRALDSWFVNDLIIRYQIETKTFAGIDFKFMIVNLFNHKYESNAWVYRYYAGEYLQMDGFYPQAGIHVMSGITLNF